MIRAVVTRGDREAGEDGVDERELLRSEQAKGELLEDASPHANDQRERDEEDARADEVARVAGPRPVALAALVLIGAGDEDVTRQVEERAKKHAQEEGATHAKALLGTQHHVARRAEAYRRDERQAAKERKPRVGGDIIIP